MEIKMDPKKTEKEKMTEEQRRRRIDIEKELGVPDPPVPNRAHTELSTSNGNSAESSAYTRAESSKLNIDENALHEYADRYKSKRMSDSKIRKEKE